MAITDTRLIEVQATFDPAGFAQYTVMYEVSTDDEADGPIAVLESSGIPKRGDTFTAGGETDGTATLRSKQTALKSQEDTYKEWRITCNYSSAWDGNPITGGPGGVNPLSEPAQWSGGLVQYSKEFTKDREGNAIKNAAGDPFVDPPVTGDDSRMSIRCTKNFASGNIPEFISYKDSINTSAFWGFEERRVKVQSLEFEQRYYLGSPFLIGRIEVHVTEATSVKWDDEVLNAGYFERWPSGRRVRIFDDDGSPTSIPWALTTNGIRMASTDVYAGNQTYVDAKKYPLKDLTAIGFPTVLGAPS